MGEGFEEFGFEATQGVLHDRFGEKCSAEAICSRGTNIVILEYLKAIVYGKYSIRKATIALVPTPMWMPLPRPAHRR